MNKMCKRMVAFMLVALMVATSVMPQNVSASEVQQVLEKMSDTDAASENDAESQEEKQTERKSTAEDDFDEKGETDRISTSESATEETEKDENVISEADSTNETTIEKSVDGDFKTTEASTETIEKEGIASEGTTDEEGTTSETTTVGEETTTEESVDDTASTAEKAKGRQARNAVGGTVILQEGVTVAGNTGDSETYTMAPSVSGMYLITVEADHNIYLNSTTTYYYQDEDGNKVEKSGYGWTLMNNVTSVTKVVYLNKEERYQFTISASNEAANYSLTISKPVTLKGIETVKNLTNDVYQYIDYEGLELQYTFVETGDDAKEHNVVSKVDSYLNSTYSYAYVEIASSFSSPAYNIGNYSFDNYLDTYYIVSIDDNKETLSIADLSLGKHTVKMYQTVTTAGQTENYEFSFTINKIDNSNIEKIEIKDPQKLIYTQMGGLKKQDITVTYNDGTTKEIKTSDSSYEVEYGIVEESNESICPDLKTYMTYKNIDDTKDLNIMITYQVSYRGVKAQYEATLQYSPYTSVKVEPTRTMYFTNTVYTEGNSSYGGRESIYANDLGKITLTKKDGSVEEYEYCWNLDYQGNPQYGFVSTNSEEEVIDANITSYLNAGGKTGKVKVRFTYAGVSCEYDATIKEMKYDHIKIQTLPSRTKYLNGGTTSLDMEGMVIRAYEDEKETKWKDYSYDDYQNQNSSMSQEDRLYMQDAFGSYIGGHESLAALAKGKHNITVYLGANSATYEIEVVDTVIDSLSVTLDQNTFILGELNERDLATAVENSIRYIIVDGEEIYRYSSEYWDYYYQYGDKLSVKEKKVTEAGTYEVEISWLGKTITVTVSVVEKLIESMEITKQPTMTEFYAGVDNDICLSYKGLELQMTDLEGTVKKYKYGYDPGDYDYDEDDYDSSYGSWYDLISGDGYSLSWDTEDVDWSKTGNYTVYLCYKGVKAPVSITLVEIPYKKMTFDLKRTTYFVSDSNTNMDWISSNYISNIKFYDANNNVVATYEDYYDIPLYYQRVNYGLHSEGSQSFYQDPYSFINYGGGKLGQNQFVLKYGNLETTVNVTIEDRTPYKIEVTKKPTNLTYTIGEDKPAEILDGMVLRVYSDKDTYKEFDYTKYRNATETKLNGMDKDDFYYYQMAFRYYLEDDQSIYNLVQGSYKIHIKIGGKEAEEIITINAVPLSSDFKASFINGEDKYLTTTDTYAIRKSIQFSFKIKEQKYENVLYGSRQYWDLCGQYDYPFYSIIKPDDDDFEYDYELPVGEYILKITWLGNKTEVKFSVVNSVISNLKVSVKEDSGDWLISCADRNSYVRKKILLSFVYNNQTYENVDIAASYDEYEEPDKDTTYGHLIDKFGEDEEIRCSMPDIQEKGTYDVTFSFLGATATTKVSFTDKLIQKMEVVKYPDRKNYLADPDDDWVYVDLEGLILGITELDGTYYEVEYDSTAWNSLKNDETYIRDFNDINGSVPGEYKGSISYKGVEVEIPVTVIDTPVKSVEITKMPDKTKFYQPETNTTRNVNIDGLKFTLYYKDGTKTDAYAYSGMTDNEINYYVRVEYEGIRYSGSFVGWKEYEYVNGKRYAKLGENAIRYRILSYTFEIPVTVEESPIKTIQCDTKPAKDKYFVRHNGVSDLYSASFTVIFKDGTEQKVEGKDHKSYIIFEKGKEQFEINSQVESQYDEDDVYEGTVLTVKCLDQKITIPVSIYYYEKEKAKTIEANSIVDVKVTEEEPYMAYAFTPTKEGTYKFYSLSDGEDDPYGYLCDQNGNLIERNDDDEDLDYGNFKLVCELEKGKTYYYVATSYDIGSQCSFQCVLEDETGFFGEDKIESFAITEHPYQWYDFENPEDHLQLHGLKYEIKFQNGYTYSKKVDTYRTFDASKDNDDSWKVLGIPMKFEWTEFETDDNGVSVPAETDTNRIRVIYAGKTVELVPKLHQETPVKSLEVVKNPWENFIVNEDTTEEDLFYATGELLVKINYKDGSSKELDYFEDEGYLNGYSLRLDYDKKKQEVTITYMGVNTKVSLAQKSVKVSNITLKQKPTKDTYADIQIGQLKVKDAVDLSGAKFEVFYTDGSSEIREIEKTVSGWKIMDDYEVTAEFSGSLLTMKCKNLTFQVDVKKTTIADLAGENKITFKEEDKNAYFEDFVTYKDKDYKVWAFTPSETEENKVAEYTFQAKDGYSYLLTSKETLLQAADNEGVITRELYPGTTYYYVVVKDTEETTNVSVTKTETINIGDIAIDLEAPEAGKALAKETTLSEKSVSGTGYRVETVQWNPTAKDNIAESGKVYTATITVKPELGYQFTANINASVNNKNVITKSLSSDGTLTLKYTFARTKCLVAIPTVEHFTLGLANDVKGTKDDTTGMTIVPVDYKGSLTFTYTYQNDREIEGTTTLNTVKANGNVLTKNSNNTDAYEYTIKSIVSATTVVAVTKFTPKEDEVKLTLVDKDETSPYDEIAVVKEKSVSDKTEGEDALPVLESYQDDSDQFFYGWYDNKTTVANENDTTSTENVDDKVNGTGTRFLSTTKLSDDKTIYAKWGQGIFVTEYNGLQATYKILSIDEKNKIRVELSELAPQNQASAVSVYALGRAASNEEEESKNVLTLPGNVDLSELLKKAGIKDITGSNKVDVVSIGKNAIKTNIANKIIVPETVENIEDHAFGDCTDLEEVVIPDSVEDVTKKAFTSESASGDGNGTTTNQVNVVCSEETAQKLNSTGDDTEGSTTSTIITTSVSIEFRIDSTTNYAYTDKEFTYGDAAFKVKPVVVTTKSGGTTTESKDITSESNPTEVKILVKNANGVEVTDDECFELSIDSDKFYSIKPKKVTDAKKTYQFVVKADDVTITKELSLKVNPLSLQSMYNNDTESRFTIEKLDDVIYNGKIQKKEITVTDKSNTTEKILDEGTDYKVSYSNSAIDVGMVTVTVTGINNYTGTLSSSYRINKKSVDITAKNLEMTFGTDAKINAEATASVTGENAKDVPALSYTSDNVAVATVDASGKVYAKKVGTANITVSVADGNNYTTTPKVIKVTVKKATIDMSDVVFADETVTYDGKSHSLTAMNLPDGVSVSYAGNNQTQVGTYKITARFTVDDAANYNTIADKTATLTIKKADMTMSGVVLADQTVTYDGKAHSLTATGVPAGVTVTYEGNNQTEAGTYKVTARFTTNGNYNAIPDKTATLTINKANVDMSGVIFADQTAIYDGKEHSLVATGLPTGVTASYVGNQQVNTGSYTVTARFSASANYNAIADKTAVLTILLNKGYNYSDKNLKYKVVNNATDGTGTVSVVGYKAKKAKLTKVSIPATVTIQGTKYLVTDIAKNTFKGCTKLKNLTIGKNVVTIGNSAFEKCNALTKVTLPAKIKTLGSSVFKNCKKLKNITVKSKVVKTVGKNAFKGVNSKATIKVPAAKLKAYQKLFKKKGQGSKVKIKK